jgi:hypothetical protein
MAYIGDETAVCERCIKIDIQIERYRQIAKMISDEITLDGIDSTIADLEAQKLALHPTSER